jgi:uncharacterized protein (DUF849 family)
MLLKAAINGKRSVAEHPSIPITPIQQAHEAILAVAAGAGAIHVHPRSSSGEESLVSSDVDPVLNAVRAACPGTPVGVSTGAWIVADIKRRLELIDQWNLLPDFAGVNFHEPGAVETCKLLLKRGVGVEAGIWNAEAAHVFHRSGLASRCVRILLEPAQEPGDAKIRLDEVDAALEGLNGRRLLHGFGESTWEFISLAASRGYDTRIGFEDTLVLPDGSRAEDNGELVAVAREIIAQFL